MRKAAPARFRMERACLEVLENRCLLSDVTVTISTTSPTTLTGARGIGTNLDTPFISDSMRLANGAWLEQTVASTKAPILRWGAIHWDGINERQFNTYQWLGQNSPDDEGTLSLDEFFSLCKRTGAAPLVIVPFEPHSADGTSITKLSDLVDTAKQMAQLAKSYNFTTDVYFEVGNEPYNQSDKTATYYANSLDDYYNAIKAVDSRFKVVASINSNYYSAVSAVSSYFDATDWHEYPDITWSNYVSKTNDNFGTGGSIAGKEKIIGETWVMANFWASGAFAPGFGRDLIQLNHMANLINTAGAKAITAWPSVFAGTDLTTSNTGIWSYGDWTTSGQTLRNTGPAVVYSMINNAVLERWLSSSSSSDAKVRQFAYTDASTGKINVILINKYDTSKTLDLALPRSFGRVSGMKLTGTSLTDTAPSASQFIASGTAVNAATFSTTLPAYSAVMLQFYDDTASTAPAAFNLTSPAGASAATNVSTMHNFTWAKAVGATAYHLTISTSSNLSSPLVDLDLGNVTNYQATTNLAPGTRYYWRVTAKNAAGSTHSSIASFFTGTTLRSSTLSSAAGFNGAFESDPINANGWQAVADGGSTPTFTWDSSTYHGGTRAAKITATSAAGAAFAKTSSANRVPVNSGSLYAVRVWGKSSSVSDPNATFETAKNSNVYVQFYDAAGNTLGPKSQAGWGWSGTADWRQVHLLAPAPDTAVSMSIELRLDAPGTMWFDDLTVTEYSDQPVRNHNFEDGATNWSYATVVTDNARSGSKAMRLGGGSYTEQQILDLQPGKPYTFTAWAKNSSATGTSAYLGITFRDSAGNTLSGGASAQVTTTSYQKYALDITVPANAVRADVWAWTASTHQGYLYVDDVTLTGRSLVKLSGRIIGTPGSWSNDVDRSRVVAFDGDLATFFDAPDANASNAWVGIDLGRASVISQIKYAPRSGQANRMVGGKFQASNTADFSSGVVDLTSAIASNPTVGQLTTVNVTNPSAYRYVRYLAPASSWGNIAEMEVYGLGTPAALPSMVVTGNLALGKTTNASSVENNDTTNRGANLATDGNSSSRWASGYADNNSAQWISVDLGDTYNVSRVKLNWEAAYAADYLIQYSTNGSDWYTFGGGTVTGNSSSGVRDYTLTTASAQYVRISMTKVGPYNNYSLYDFEVYA